MSKAKARNILRKVAQMVYDKQYGPFSAGLCHATVVLCPYGTPFEESMTPIRMVQKYMRPNQSWLAKPGTKWDQRAMFALLVAEAEK